MSETTGQKLINSFVIKSHPIGSRYVCDPPVMDTDKDTLLLVHDIKPVEEFLLSDGWTPCHKGEYIDGFFKAYRKGVDNYVVTAHELFFDRYCLAAQVAKALNVKDKETRIKIHNASINASSGFVGLVNWDTGRDTPVYPFLLDNLSKS